uniref:AncQR n=1 Tax=synthetic construct TaxID=32630 RepID=UPI000763546F|nr:Chain A, AncQR [synthetic construct]4ZV2_A Chain A, AncQR [synthetic construct]
MHHHHHHMRGTLRVGTEATFPPFGFKDENGKLVGFDIDLAKAIAKKLGVKVEFKPMDFDGIIPALQSGKIDVVIAGMTITEERKKQVDFSDPYFEAGQAIVVKKGNDSIKSLEDLKGKKVGVQLGSTSEQHVKKVAKDAGVKVKKFDNFSEAFQELKSGRVDAVVTDNAVALAYVKQNPNAGVKIVGETFSGEPYGIAVRKGNSELLEKINKALEEMKKDGTYDKIYEKWFGE